MDNYSVNEPGWALLEEARDAGHAVSVLSNLSPYNQAAIERKWPHFFQATHQQLLLVRSRLPQARPRDLPGGLPRTCGTSPGTASSSTTSRATWRAPGRSGSRALQFTNDRIPEIRGTSAWPTGLPPRAPEAGDLAMSDTDTLVALVRGGPTASWSSPGPGSPPGAASATSAGPRGSGRPGSRSTSTTFSQLEAGPRRVLGPEAGGVALVPRRRAQRGPRGGRRPRGRRQAAHAPDPEHRRAPRPGRDLAGAAGGDPRDRRRGRVPDVPRSAARPGPHMESFAATRPARRSAAAAAS